MVCPRIYRHRATRPASRRRQNLRDATGRCGVPVQLRNADTLVHGYLDFARIVPAANEEFRLSLDACKTALQASPRPKAGP